MAGWITHMIIADELLKRNPGLDRRGFCVGNIAPDCNIENEDWTAFTPPREVTHWMTDERKRAGDYEAFADRYITGREFSSSEERSFLLGYCSHLITDAAFQRYIRDPKLTENTYARIKQVPWMLEKIAGLPETFTMLKRTFGKPTVFHDIFYFEQQYLSRNPETAYLTVLPHVKEFPDYLDYLPHGAIPRKIPLMATIPSPIGPGSNLFFPNTEYAQFLTETCTLIESAIT